MTRKSSPKIEVIIEDANWRKLSPRTRTRMQRASLRALEREKAQGALTILLAGDARLKALNALFRGKNKPTNVLSFPSAERGYLGDVAIAYGVVKKEARAAGRTLSDHLAHLAVHGTLHVLGHDHEKPREARRMETLETEILAEFGIADPYAVTRKSRTRHG